jgi:succinate dehydrogenase / fumarate reductase membrane anchor subunit
MKEHLAARARTSSNFELYSWLFMRISGVLIALLLLGHIAIMHIIHHVDDVTYQFAAQRLANPFWRIYDLALLGLALTHGLLGARISLDDYIHNRGWRVLLKTVLWLTGTLFLVVGAFVLFTFEPALG